MGKKASMKQFEIMIEYLENNQMLFRNDGTVGKEIIQKKWQELADMLNSESTGVYKSVDRWKKSFQDWKSYVKKKAAKRHSELNKTGNQGEPDFEPLTELEEKLLFLTGRIAAEGDSGVKESDVIMNDCEIYNSNAENEYPEIQVYDVTPIASSSTEVFSRICSKGKFSKRRLTMTEELSKQLIKSQEDRIAEMHRLADIAENKTQLYTEDVQVKRMKLELEAQKNKLVYRTQMHNLRLTKLKYL